MEGVTDRGNSLLTAADDKGNALSRSDLINEKPKKWRYSPQNVFSLGYKKSLFSSLSSSPQMRTCHCCSLFGSLRCSQCKQVHYCSVDCQKKDWAAHRVVCEPLKQNVSNNNGGKLPAETNKGVYLKGNSTSLESLGTEKHVKKIMLSDLQTLGIKPAMEIQGTVTEFKSQSEFYIQMSSPEILNQISKLSLKLQECYADTVIQEQYIAIQGEVCVARYSQDQTWNRALIKDVDLLQKKALIFYIDYGNEEYIPLSWIKALHKDIELLFPPCAIKCSLANYDPKEERWNEGMASFSSQLTGKHCSVTVVDILQEEIMLNFVVDVVFPDVGDCLDKIPLKIRSDVTPGSNATGGDSPRGTASENHTKGSKEKTGEHEDFLHCSNSVAECVSVCIGDVFPGVVSCIQNPENFYCQQTRSACQLAELEVSLNEYCDKSPSSSAFQPAAGDVCCAQFTEDNLWYRAAVIACVSENTVLVGYIDYGNLEVLPLTRLRPLIPRLMHLPAQAIRCTLAGVKPPLEAWTSEAISFMKQLVKDKVFTVEVVDKESYGSVVKLVDASVTPVINLSSYLIERGCAAEKSGMALPTVRMSDVKQANEDATEERIYKWSKLTLEQTVDVVVCTLYSPREFYCQISNKSVLLALRLLNKSLSEYCQKTPPNVFKLENREPCCAFFSDDGNWYRALVQNVTSCGTAKVCFVDYGNTEEVPLDKIRQISSSFLQLPFQGIKCWLSETSLRRWKSIELAIDETVPVCVTEVVSPHLFYAVPVQTKVGQEKLHKELLIDLEGYCKSFKNQPFKPKRGEACCARFSGDGHWYRALVLQASRSVVKVLYADYGNTETLPLSKVLPITNSYLKLPFQIIVCSLAGIEKAGWSPLLLEKLKELLLNKYVTITVKGINGSVNLVTVETLCENGSLNVADKLITEGLVKACSAENIGTEHQGDGGETKCCCRELKMQLKRHEQILLFLLNQNPDRSTEMKKLLDH
uniref:Tudor domain containing 1 n=1 Tax=Falco tinnunculus TaxID=100819 RepID=A0A8C4UDS7_FALTI